VKRYPEPRQRSPELESAADELVSGDEAAVRAAALRLFREFDFIRKGVNELLLRPLSGEDDEGLARFARLLQVCLIKATPKAHDVKLRLLALVPEDFAEDGPTHELHGFTRCFAERGAAQNAANAEEAPAGLKHVIFEVQLADSPPALHHHARNDVGAAYPLQDGERRIISHVFLDGVRLLRTADPVERPAVGCHVVPMRVDERRLAEYFEFLDSFRERS
jgi:hypothetical protein